MIAMREEEVFALLAFFAFMLAVVWMVASTWLKGQRLRTLQKALDNAQLDDLTRRSLIDAVAAEASRAQQAWQALVHNAGRLLRRSVFVIGWLTLVISGTVLIGMLANGNYGRYDYQGAIIALGVGFALITLPLALRELDARRA